MIEQPLTNVRLEAVLFTSANPEALAAFYQKGFELEAPKFHGSDHLGLNLANTYLGFDRVQEDAATSREAVSIWFHVQDIETAFKRLIGLGAKVKYTPTKEESPGEILAMLYDPEGNSIGLISPA